MDSLAAVVHAFLWDARAWWEAVQKQGPAAGWMIIVFAIPCAVSAGWVVWKDESRRKREHPEEYHDPWRAILPGAIAGAFVGGVAWGVIWLAITILTGNCNC